jgi:hypothetical protein
MTTIANGELVETKLWTCRLGCVRSLLIESPRHIEDKISTSLE